MARKAIIALCTLMVPSVGLAQDVLPGEFGVGVGVSTLGLTVEPSYRINDQFGLRAPLGYATAGFTADEDDFEFDGDATLGGVGLLADFYPGLAGFRISGGVIYSLYSVDADAVGSGQVGDTFYDDVRLEAEADVTNRFMPTLSLGYDGNITESWTLSADIGVTYTGGWDVDLTDTTGQVSQEDIDAELGDIEDDAPDFLPYLKLTVAYRF